MIRNGLKALKGNLLYAVVGSLLAGLIVGQFIGGGARETLRLLVIPALFVMVSPMMISIDMS